ncbi:MAG: hypothetical protein RLZZ13_1039, partial [Pseudomonadota bacterium]
YTHQSIEELATSIDVDGGLRTPIIVTEKYEIIDGFRRVEAMLLLGKEYIEVWIDDVEPTIFERIIRNMYRTKTTDDQVKELKSVFVKFPKRMGKKSDDGEVYNRSERISKALNKKYSGKETISNLEYILNNDIENNILSKGIIEKNWKVETCHDYLTIWKSIDLQYQYGYTKDLLKNCISVSDAIKFIKEEYRLTNEYKDSLIIPDKCYSFNIDCVEISKMKEFENSIDLIITSPPYLNLRKYDTEEIIQLGHEENKDEYCKNVANIFSQLYPTLKKTANVFINIGESFSEGVGLGIPQLLKHYIETETKLIYKDQLIWSKSNPKPQNETIKRPINNIEYILWFVVDPKIAKYNLLTYTKPGKKATKCSGVKDVSSNGEVQKRNKSISKPYSKIYCHLKEQDIANIIELKTCKNFDVYNISSKGHPAIMSPLLPVIPILMCSDENTVENKSIIYDPFSGSNVVSRIGQLLNRTTISTELSHKYFSIGCKMLENSIKDFNSEELKIINQIAYGEENLVSIAA